MQHQTVSSKVVGHVSKPPAHKFSGQVVACLLYLHRAVHLYVRCHGFGAAGMLYGDTSCTEVKIEHMSCQSFVTNTQK